MLRKLSLVTLTGYMERHCPTHRSGWNWELPKFIKKIKTPDYKGTVVNLIMASIQCQSIAELSSSFRQKSIWSSAGASTSANGPSFARSHSDRYEMDKNECVRSSESNSHIFIIRIFI